MNSKFKHPRILFLLFSILLLMPTAANAASVNDTARFLAGMKPSAGSPLAALTNENAWKIHSRTLDAAWKRIEKNQLKNIRAWSEKNLPNPAKQMLYMFSGPDFLYANAFFPHAQTYLLSALEPVGSAPKMEAMSAGVRAGALQELRGQLQTVLNYSFFITKQMKVHMRGGRIIGNLPVILVFLARSGNTIDDVEFVRLNQDGLVVPPDVGFQGSAPGVRVSFKDEKGKGRELYYFQTDLSNGGLNKSGFRAFSETLGPADSLLKSASYLLHSGNFTVAREYLLKQSNVIVQDASGIPLRAFPKQDWEFHPFGRYAGPIAIFQGRYQRDMANLFAKGRAKPVNFGIGYRWRRHETHTLLAKKKK